MTNLHSTNNINMKILTSLSTSDTITGHINLDTLYCDRMNMDNKVHFYSIH